MANTAQGLSYIFLYKTAETQIIDNKHINNFMCLLYYLILSSMINKYKYITKKNGIMKNEMPYQRESRSYTT